MHDTVEALVGADIPHSKTQGLDRHGLSRFGAGLDERPGQRSSVMAA